MQPLLRKWSQRKRNAMFLPILSFTFIVGFFLGALPTSEFVVGLLSGPVVGLGATYALVGWPHLTTRSGKALITPDVKPWLFFLVFPAAAMAIYLVLGVFLTPVLPPDLLAYVSLGIAVAGAFAAGYVLTGLPPVARTVYAQWTRIPAHVKPWLFLAFAPLVGVVAYLLVGVALTPTPVPLEVQPYIVLPIAIAVGCAVAYKLVGVPRPEKPVHEYVPDVPGRLRPAAFAITTLVVGLVLSYLVGLGLGAIPVFPHAALLPVAFVVGYALAAGVAALAWGTPKSWQERFPDYKPGLPEGARLALFVPVVIIAALVGAVLATLAKLDLYWGLLAGSMAGVLVALKVTGVFRRLREVRGDSPTLLPELPDMVKPLVLFPVWFLVGGLVFVSLSFALPDAMAWNAALGLAVGLAVAVGLVEEPTLREMRAERRERKARLAAIKRKRAEALKAAAKGAPEDA